MAGDYEDQNHVLANGNIDEEIWRRISSQIGMPYTQGRGRRERVELWFRRANNSSPKGSLFGLIPPIVIWQLWMWRCDTKMDGKYTIIDVPQRNIKFWISQLGLKLKEASKFRLVEEKISKNLNVKVKSRYHKNMHIVRWSWPYEDGFKLNINGSSLRNPSSYGAGGIIQTKLNNDMAITGHKSSKDNCFV